MDKCTKTVENAYLRAIDAQKTKRVWYRLHRQDDGKGISCVCIFFRCPLVVRLMLYAGPTSPPLRGPELATSALSNPMGGYWYAIHGFLKSKLAISCIASSWLFLTLPSTDGPFIYCSRSRLSWHCTVERVHKCSISMPPIVCKIMNIFCSLDLASTPVGSRTRLPTVGTRVRHKLVLYSVGGRNGRQSYFV